MGDEAWRLVAYCGLHCGECGTYQGKFFRMLSRELKELIEARGDPDWVPRFGGVDFNYEEFLKGLTYYTKLKSGCFNENPCKGGCQIPGCTIKPCAKERGVEICFECDEFPCEKFSGFLERHPDHKMEYEEFKKLGRDEWLKIHAQRVGRGYCRATNKYYTTARQALEEAKEI